MLDRTNVAVLLVAVAILIGYQVASAAPPPEGESYGQDYVVQADDWLSKLADKFYGDAQAYQAIVDVTNAKAAVDSAYTPIDNPDVIEIGQRLFVPDDVDAVAEILASLQAQPAAPVEEVVQAVQPAVSEAVAAMPEANNTLQPTAEQVALLASLEIKGTPPELNNDVWLNSEPLKLAGLKGNVVIIEFWTYG